VGMVAFLISNAGGAVAIGPEVATELATLGVTNATILRDRSGVCLVLEGWAFDAEASAARAADLLGPDKATLRILRPVMQTALRAATEEA